MAITRLSLEDLTRVVGGAHISGTVGHDTLVGDAGHDTLVGLAGNDVLVGGAGSDYLGGGDGDDTLNGGTRDRVVDMVEGGAGSDTYLWQPGDGADHFYGDQGRDTLQLSNVTLEQLQQGLQPFATSAGLQMQINGNEITFLTPSGFSANFNGQINIRGEVLSLFSVERITLA